MSPRIRSASRNSAIRSGSRYRRLVAGFVVLGAACSTGDTGNAGGSGDDSRVGSDAVQVVGTSESIARIRDVQPTADGVIWVLNSVEPFFIALDASGRELRSVGREGGGPDEFRMPNTLVSGAAPGDVWAYDRGTNTLARVNDTEASRTVLRLSRDSMPPDRIITMDNAGTGTGRYWIRPADNGFAFGRGRPGSDDLRQIWNMDVVRYDSAGGIEVLFSPADHVGDPTALYGEASEFMPFPLIDLCTDGSLALYDPGSNTLRRLLPGGAATDSMLLPEPRLLAPDVDVFFAMIYPTLLEEAPPGALPDSAALHGMLRLQWPEISRQMAPVMPEYVDMQCAGDVVWLQPLDPGSGQLGRGLRWLRITPDGTVEPIELPDRFRPVRFTPDRIWGVHRGDYDVESVAWIATPAR